MFDFLFGIALILFGLPPSGDTISANGFEALDVYISTDRPSGIVWSIDSTPSHDAAFVTSSTFLNDGKVAVPTRMTWDTGAQSTPRYVMLTGSIALTIPQGGLVSFALLMPKTPYAVPAGVVTYLTLVDGLSNAMQVQTQTVLLNSGAVAAVGVAKNPLGGAFNAVTVQVQIFNAQYPGPATWATPGQTFDVGEIWFGNLQEFKLATDPKLTLIDPTLMRRSHSNQPWPLFLKPYKQWTFNFTPMSNTKAYDSSSVPSFDSVRYAIASATCGLFLPRIYTPGTTTINTTDLNQLACFGKPDSVGPLAGVQAGPLWTATALVGEAPA